MLSLNTVFFTTCKSLIITHHHHHHHHYHHHHHHPRSSIPTAQKALGRGAVPWHPLPWPPWPSLFSASSLRNPIAPPVSVRQLGPLELPPVIKAGWKIPSHSSWLVGGLEHEFYLSIYWEESSQLTKPCFSEG